MIAADRDEEKRAAAEAAVAEIEAGMLVGLGTGTTAAFAIAAVGARVKTGLNIRAVATSLATARAAEAAGITVIAMDDHASVDLCIDGVDEIDSLFRAIKGGGGAMVREKIVATAAARNIAIADSSKLVDRIGARPVPIEILPLARAFIAEHVSVLGGKSELRRNENGLFQSDQGNPVLDCRFGPIADPPALSAVLDALPGVVGHGLFLTEIDALFIGTPEGVRKMRRTPSHPKI
ncbi:ribose 5-phosphate isomerase A [Sphingomonas vulcanisoli]|uniref:Ribose-5-phosphate isomerase A n=1 Tax=Sphingomonas vulcanisoli TaxID=1658060 RepID=A0ABX0TSP0_9SPHN|nr:ribose-5-phosphate isomerase RpiA [Sphingomonas vulcanisoli]NIJ08103.1 ribose 5-phosphate isomerase A [Sphingomonas vulcanisoli]